MRWEAPPVPVLPCFSVTSKCQIFCKTGVLQGIGERLYWKRELKLNACFVNDALFIQIDMDFAMEDVKNRADFTCNFNKSSYFGRQFPKEITQAVEVPADADFMEFRTVVQTEFPSHTVLSTGEIDAIDQEDQLVEIKCLRGGFDNRFWKERSCKLFLQMFFSGSRRCIQGHSKSDHIIDIGEIDLDRLAEKGADLPDRLFPWYKDDVLRFIDEFLASVYARLSQSPKTVFTVTKDEGHSRFHIEKSEMAFTDFFPMEFLTHFNIDT
uniref:Decapping nuclease n=1 Tax=Steinernema glaseri TaxID=37863 RepID=A0A1I7YKZ7_9BILA